MSIIIKSGSNGNLANVDILGNLLVAASPSAISQIAAAWTTATVVDSTQALMVTGGWPAIIVQLNQTSTITGGAVTFEGTYDGIDWVTLPVSNVLNPVTYAPAANPYTFQPSTNYATLILTGGFQQVRARLNPVISGTGSVTIYYTLRATNPQSDAAFVTAIQGTSPWVVSGTVAVSNFPAVQVVTLSPPTVNQGTSPWVTADTILDACVSANKVNVTVSNFPAVQVVTLSPPTVNQGTSPWIVQDTAAETSLSTIAGAVVANHMQVIFSPPTVNQGTSPWVTSISNFPAVQVVTLSPPTLGVTQSTSPWVVSNGGTFAVQEATLDGCISANKVAVSLASTTITGTVAVTQSTNPWVVTLSPPLTSIAVTQSTSPWVVAGALTNNNAVPVATLIGVLPAIAETAYNTVTYTTGDMVLPVTDLHGALNQDLQAVAGVQLGSTAVTNFGTAPAAAAVPGVNASLFVGTTGLTVTGTSLNANVTNFPAVQVVTLSPPTLGVTQSTSPWVSNITQWATVTLSPPTAWGAAPSGTVIGVNAELFVGNNAVSATAPVPVSATAAANAKTNPIYEAIADGTNTSVLGAMGTAPATSIFALPVMAGLIANVSGTPTALTATSTSLNVNITGGISVVTLSPPTVSVTGPSSTTANAVGQTTVTSGGGSILSSNASRLECTIVNTGTVVVYLGLNGKTPTFSPPAYHIALSACTSANDGTGGTYTTDLVKGQINAIVASTSGTVMVTELTA